MIDVGVYGVDIKVIWEQSANFGVFNDLKNNRGIFRVCEFIKYG